MSELTDHEKRGLCKLIGASTNDTLKASGLTTEERRAVIALYLRLSDEIEQNPYPLWGGSSSGEAAK